MRVEDAVPKMLPSMIECEGVNKDTLTYYILDIDIVSKMDYMLWLMTIEMNEFIDDWKGPHSLLVTSCLFDNMTRSHASDRVSSRSPSVHSSIPYPFDNSDTDSDNVSD